MKRLDQEYLFKNNDDESTSFWQNVANNYRYTYLPIVSSIEQMAVGKPDPNFTVKDEMLFDKPPELVDELVHSQSQQEFDYHVNLHRRMSIVKESLAVNGGFGSMLFAGVLDPINLIPIKSAVGMGFWKGAKRTALGVGAIVGGVETARSQVDPTYHLMESAVAIPFSMAFGGLFGGTVGALTAQRAGKNIAKGTAHDNGESPWWQNVKTEEVKGLSPSDKMAKRKTSADIVSDTELTLKEEGIRIEDDPNLNIKQEEYKLKKTGTGYEETARLTFLGRLRHRFDSNRMGKFVNQLFNDGGTINRRTAEGAVNETSVNNMIGFWRGHGYDYISKTRELWLESKNINKSRKVLTQDVTFTYENIKSKINKSQTYDDFMREVTIADMKASHLGDEAIANVSPQIKKALKLTRELNDLAKKHGQDAMLFNNSVSLKYKMDSMADFSGKLISNIESLKKQLPTSTRKNTIQFKINNNEKHLDEVLYEMAKLERFAFSLLRKEKDLYGAIDDVIDDIDNFHMRRKSYKQKYSELIKTRNKRNKKLKELAKEIMNGFQQRHQDDLKILSELAIRYKTVGLSDKALTYMKTLEKRIANHKYSEKQQKVLDQFNEMQLDPNVTMTKKQLDFYKTLEKELKEPIKFDVRAAINSLKESIEQINKDFTGPKVEKYYTHRMWDTGTIMDKRIDFEEKVVIPWIMEHPSGRLATLIEASKNGEELLILPDEMFKGIDPAIKIPVEKSFFTRLPEETHDFNPKKIAEITKNENVYILDDGRLYTYNEKQFGSFKERFKIEENAYLNDHDYHQNTPHLIQSAIKKTQINGRKVYVFELKNLYDTKDLAQINERQLQILIRQAKYIRKSYPNKPERIKLHLKMGPNEEPTIIKGQRVIDLLEKKNLRSFFKKKNLTRAEQIEQDFWTMVYAPNMGQKIIKGNLPYKVTPVRQKLDLQEDMGIPKQMIKENIRVPTQQDIDAQARIQSMRLTNKIIGDADQQNHDGIAGRGSQKFVMHRNFNIPNYLLTKEGNGIADFINTNGGDIMRTYMNKFGPAVEMARMFNGDRFGQMQRWNAFDDSITRHSDDIENDPVGSLDRFLYQEEDLDAGIDALLNRVHKGTDIGSTSNRLVKAAQQIGQLTMMGMATIASFADAAIVILARGFKDSYGRYAGAWIKSLEEVDMKDASNQHMVKFIGEGNEIVSQAGASRFVEVDSGLGEINNRVLGKTGDKILNFIDKAAGGFYTANLLNQWTGSMKRLVIPMSVDRILRTGAILSKEFKGDKRLLKYLDVDLQILRSHGLSSSDLKTIYKLWKEAGGKKGKDIFYSNADLWMDKAPNIFRKYINAVRSDVIGTIITPTDADKPLLSYGMLKLSRFNKNMQDRQHNMFKLPIQFMSWSFAANNKIVISTLQGRHKAVMSGILSMFAMGMLSDYARNPGWWHYKSTDEKIIKAIEYSGVTGYLLDINSFAEITTNNWIGLRPLFGSENPFTGSVPDQISEIGGPVGSMITDVYKMMFEDDLETKDKAGMFRRLIPYNNLFYTKWLFMGLQDKLVDNETTLRFD